ncbi:MAG: hypothetical protein AVDCRST_MAG33-1907 [uncultured Thermomicrobiales bacterium]|uniref:FAD-binding PCMH-type domain-containing protein n=1 Tax=uncultured Thermomicrobiales bacterium TaxID=1645740 RepID=A0A6J4V136_9BACT|nr:MAG: hypothetical protein AVDCRST_MAG33-1907 [uncultured Thermomicrobiales bacterium]
MVLSAFRFDTLAATSMILRERVQGTVLTPDSEGFAAAHMPFNCAVQHAPALVVLPETARDIVETVRFAAANDLAVTVQATGHGVRSAIEGGVLINTSRMTGVTIDPERRTARVEAGTRWAAVVAAAAGHGLAPLNGSSVTVGVVGYTLGGGTGWLARKYGFAADRVVRAEVVTADGRQLVASETENVDLFHALRGGGGSFGIVTALEFGLVPVAEVFAGMVVYPMERSADVFTAYAAWAEGNPEELTSSIALMRLPPIPAIPEPLRGRDVVIVRGCYTGDLAAGEQAMRPMRELGAPILDTFGVLPWAMNGTISADPEDAFPHSGSHLMLDDLSPATITAVLSAVGPGCDSALMMVEIRHIEGATRHAGPSTAIANRTDAPFVLFAAGALFAPEMVPAVTASHAALRGALAPHAVEGAFPNFLGYGDADPERYRAAFSPATYDRLVAARDRFDPSRRFRHNGLLAAE